MFRILVFGVVLLGALSHGVQGQAAPIPPKVVAEYKAYKTSLLDKDFKGALKHAKLAWKNAESTVGDSQLTGDLAYNYGFLASKMAKSKLAAEAFERSVALAGYSPGNAALVRLEREVELTSALMSAEQNKKAWTVLGQAREFAAAHNLDDTVFAGELMVHQGLLKHNRANSVAKHGLAPAYKTGTNLSRVQPKNRKGSHLSRLQSNSADYARVALEIFEKDVENARPDYMASAYKLIGFSHERDKEWMDAALMYQKSMLIQKEYSDLEDVAYVSIVGRWLNARNYLRRADELELAREKGLCKCWPYDEEENVTATALKRVPPHMPRKATTSGYAIVKFDVDDDGNVVNPIIVHSWPEKVYVKSSLVSVRKYKYETKADGPADAQRKGLITTIHYYLRDYDGNPI